MWTIDIQHKKCGLLVKCDWRVSHTITGYFMNTGKVYFFRHYKIRKGDSNRCAVFKNFCTSDLSDKTPIVWDIRQEISNENKYKVNHIHLSILCDNKVAYKMELGLHGGKYDIIYNSNIMPEFGPRKLSWVYETGDIPRRFVPKGSSDYILEPHGPINTYRKQMWRKRQREEQ